MVKPQGNPGASAVIRPKVLFCTAAGGKYGMGHLRRCISLIEEGHRVFESSVCLVHGDKRSRVQACDAFPGYTFVRDIAEAGNVDLIVSDMMETGKKEIKEMMLRAPVISIDDLSGGRKFSFVSVYPLPNEMDVSGNVYGPSYIALDPGLKKLSPKSFDMKEGVLLSFGGTDPYNLSGYISSVLNSLGIRPKIIRGPMFQHFLSNINGEIVDNPDNIHELINSARVLITSFGLTMYEAFFLGTPVILCNNSRYHSVLAGKTRAINLGYRNAGSELKDKLQGAITDEEELRKSTIENRHHVDGKGAGRVVSIIENTIKGMRRDCLFNHGKPRACYRSMGYTIMRCGKCGDLFLFDFGGEEPGQSTTYGKDYFLTEYKNQYGKTYIEDKENVVRLGIRRLRAIEHLMRSNAPEGKLPKAEGEELEFPQAKFPQANRKLLDAGCALGFFLEIAEKRGWETRGIEISPFASEWGRKNLYLDIVTGSFLGVDMEPESFDVVTFFFVAEHFKEIEKVIEKTYNILKKNGHIALALPHRGGITYRMDRAIYLNEHPRDHYFDTSVRNLNKFLKLYGFKKRKICITGIHPERFFRKIGLKKSFKVLNAVYTFFAKTFNLGDTFEYYGVKV